jgi:hypothetical protein
MTAALKLCHSLALHQQMARKEELDIVGFDRGAVVPRVRWEMDRTRDGHLIGDSVAHAAGSQFPSQ